MPSVDKVCRNPTCPNNEKHKQPGVDRDNYRASLSQCSRCKQAHYCTKTCQRLHWKEHKKECNACVTDNARLSTRLSPTGGTWTFNPLSPAEQEALMEQWAQHMPAQLHEGMTARERMKKLGITPAIVQGLAVGNWGALVRRMDDMGATTRVQNNPPLKRGDYVEVQIGNHVKWDTIGTRGTLMEYFRDIDKWGINFELGGPGLVMAANLKRIARRSECE